MLIVVPSLGRPQWKKQVTLRNFQEMKSTREVVLCLSGDPWEGRRYRNQCIADIGTQINLTVVYTPKDIKGISDTRKWIFTEYAPSRFERHVLMLDDDLDFCYRPNMSDPSLETIKDLKLFESMFLLLEKWLTEGFVHVGLAARQGSNHFLGPETYRDATRMMNTYAYDVEALKILDVKLGRIPVMEDFDLTLQLLRKGYPNRVSYQYVWNQRGSGAEGGCSVYRTAEMQEKAAKQLQEYHPGFVTLVTKSTDTVWEDMKERADVNIQWQKAYEEGRNVCNSRSQRS